MSPKTIVATMVHKNVHSRKFMQSSPSSDFSLSNLKRDSQILLNKQLYFCRNPVPERHYKLWNS